MPDHHPTPRHPDRHTIWLTTTIDQDGHLDHAVRHDELATRSGRYTAVCGTTVYPASLLTPPGPQCLRCVTHLDATARQPSQHKTAPSRHTSGLGRVRRIPARWRRTTSRNTET